MDGNLFFTEQKRHEYRRRVEILMPGAQRQWGTMEVDQMLLLAIVPKCSQIVEIVIRTGPTTTDSMLDRIARSKEIRRLDLLAKQSKKHHVFDSSSLYLCHAARF
jgi:hypothetical protein